MPADDRVRGHVDDERLAAFVEGTLEADERASVELHLASCDTCRVLLAEVVRTVEGLAAGDGLGGAVKPVEIRDAVAVRSHRRGWLYGAAGLAAAAVVVLAVWMPRGERPELRELVEAVGARRPFEARLTGGFAYGEASSTMRGGPGGRPSPEVQIAVANLEKRALAAAEDPRAVAAFGTGLLITGEVDRAITEYEKALAHGDRRAWLLSDLSAALMTKAQRSGEQSDALLAKALDLAQEATRRDAAPVEAWFNRALAGESLLPPDAAIRAWEDYQRHESDHDWRALADRRISQLRHRGSGSSLESADEFLVELAAERRRCTDPHSDRCRGLGKLEEAYLALRAEQSQRAVDFTVQARGLLASTHRAVDVELILANVAFWERRLDRVESILAGADQIDRGTGGGREAERMHLRALLRWQRLEFAAALDDLRASAAMFERRGWNAAAARARRALADGYRQLGASGLAWASLAPSLSRARFASPLDRYLTYFAAAELARDDGAMLVAMIFQNLALESAQSARLAGPTVEALLHKAKLHAESRQVPEANAALAQADRLLSHAPDGYLAAQLALSRAHLGDPADPRAAASALTRALETFSSAEAPLLPELLRLRGQAWARAGQVEAAFRDYDAAVALIERRHATLDGETQAADYLDHAADVFRGAAGLAAGSGDVARSFDYIERSMRLGVGSRGPRPRRRPLSPGTAAIVSVVVNERLLLYVLTGADVRLIQRSIDPQQLRRAVQAFEVNPADGAAAEVLADLLVRPVLPLVSGSRLLTFVPDAALSGLAYPFISGAQRQRPLVEDYDIVVAPGLMWAEDDDRDAPDRALEDERALLVGVGAPGGAFAGLGVLSEVAGEIASLHAVYPKATVLTERAATSRAIHEGLRRATVFHFAGHAVTHATNADLSGLVVSPADGPAGSALLTAADLAGPSTSRHLRLVVLGGCGTASGPRRWGSGPLSLARVFLRRGVPQVVAAVRPTDDASTQLLLTRFHRHYAESRSGPGALNRAHRELLGMKTLSDSDAIGWRTFVALGG